MRADRDTVEGVPALSLGDLTWLRPWVDAKLIDELRAVVLVKRIFPGSVVTKVRFQ